ncbi:MAG: hypothetical protein ACREUX_20545 [Burkholderiales bacterium]
MSAIADFTVAVLDCPTCCRHFIENHVVVAIHRDRVACPHCGAHYVAPVNPDEIAEALNSSVKSSRHARRQRRELRLVGHARRKLH